MGSLNWSEAFKVAGQGIRDLAGTRIDRENREIEEMRRVALENLRNEHDVAIEKDRQEHATTLQKNNQTFESDLFDKRATFEKDKQKDDNDAADKRLSRTLGAQEAADKRKTISGAIEDANQQYSARMIALQNHRKELDTEKAKLVAELGSSADMSAFDELYDGLAQQEKQARAEHVMTVKRINSGGYGQPTEMLTPEQVRELVGEKSPNLENPADPVNPDDAGATPAAAGAQNPAQAAAAAAAAQSKEARQGGAAGPEAESPPAYGAYGAIGREVGDLFTGAGHAYARAGTRGGRPPEEDDQLFPPVAPRFGGAAAR